MISEASTLELPLLNPWLLQSWLLDRFSAAVHGDGHVLGRGEGEERPKEDTVR